MSANNPTLLKLLANWLTARPEFNRARSAIEVALKDPAFSKELADRKLKPDLAMVTYTKSYDEHTLSLGQGFFLTTRKQVPPVHRVCLMHQHKSQPLAMVDVRV